MISRVKNNILSCMKEIIMAASLFEPRLSLVKRGIEIKSFICNKT